MTHHIIPMHVLAELVVHSYPYKADIHNTLQVQSRARSVLRALPAAVCRRSARQHPAAQRSASRARR
jgi:hypothetical protein